MRRDTSLAEMVENRKQGLVCTEMLKMDIREVGRTWIR